MTVPVPCPDGRSDSPQSSLCTRSGWLGSTARHSPLCGCAAKLTLYELSTRCTAGRWCSDGSFIVYDPSAVPDGFAAIVRERRDLDRRASRPQSAPLCIRRGLSDDFHMLIAHLRCANDVSKFYIDPS